MRTLISDNLIHNLVPQFSSPNFLFHFPLLSRENPNLLNFSHRKWLYHPKTLTFCSPTAPGSLNYGGWDDPRLGGGSANSGESNQLRNLLNSLGIDDKRYIFVYLLGFICALAISRVRVSSIVVLPACVVVFAVGFSIGFVNGGHGSELSLIGTKKRPKDESFRVSIEKLGNLVDLFSGFDDKISNLKNDVRRGIENSHITVGELESYVEAMESIGLSALNARSVVEACIENISVEKPEFLEKTLNQKSFKRKKEVSETGFDLLQFVGGLFISKPVVSKANKMKDSVKRDSNPMNDRSRGNILTPPFKEKVLNPVSNDNTGNGNEGFYGDRRVNVRIQHDEMNISDIGSSGKRILENKQYSYRNSRLRFVNNQGISLKMGHQNEVETWGSDDNFLDSVDFSVDLKHVENEAMLEREQILHKTNGSYRPSHIREGREKETYKPYSREEQRVMNYKPYSREEEKVISKNDDPSFTDCQSGHGSDVGSFPSLVSEDIEFNRYLMEANDLLKEATKCFRVNGDEGHAETLLCESAKLLSDATEIKPMSLLAVGQLGNAYLLHGELKLKTSRHLRVLLTNGHQIPVQKRGKILKGLGDRVVNKEKIASALVNVCEECEELLVEAGRKYKLALSIDGSDMRALYNWGLALSFRAQLIADIGPEAAFDADKVFLAAIDKFDAIMSKSNVYTPDALFRWGVALQQRSRLRPRNSKETVKLLQQAKRLYEDALDMDSENLQVREALRSCISELRFRSY